ncbi:unnamed protein product, partial [Ixodes pacificus]
CLSCLKSIPADSPSLKCVECNNSYHVGKCAGLTKTLLKTLTREDLGAWQCATCKIHEARQTTPAARDSQEASQFSVVGATLEEPNASDLMKHILAMSTKLTEVLTRINSIEKYIDEQSDKQDAVIVKLTSQEKTVEGTEHSLEELKTAVDAAEQYSRRKNVEIHGIPKKDNENLMETIQQLSAKLQLPAPSHDSIEAVHRLSRREGKIPPIIVRFKERAVRDLWISKRRALAKERVFINENLTKLLRQLLWKTKSCAKVKGYKFVWITNGKILVREKENVAAIHAEKEQDLSKLH